MKRANRAFKEERKKRIAEAALRLFVERTYDRVKVKDIATACGISIGSVYRHFPSKESVFPTIVETFDERWQSSTPRSAEGLSHWQILEETVRRWFRHVDLNADVVLLSYRDIRRLSHESRNRILKNETERISLFSDLIKQGIEADEFRPVEVPVLAYLIAAMGHLWPLGRWYWASCGYDCNRYASEQVNIIKHLLLGEREETAPLTAAPEALPVMQRPAKKP